MAKVDKLDRGELLKKRKRRKESDSADDCYLVKPPPGLEPYHP